MSTTNQTVQATITLTLPLEQLMQLLSMQTQTPAPMPQQTPAPMPQQQMNPAPMQMPTAQQMPQAQPNPAQMPTAQQMPQAQTQMNPAPQMQQSPMPQQTAPQTYTVEQIGLAARPLMENGRQQELAALLTEFGVPSVAALPEDRRADFAARLRSMGGQI